MHHGQVAAEIAQGLLALKKRIEAAKIPPSKLDEMINIAVWNIREFGKKKRSPKLRRFSMTWWEGRMSVSDSMLHVLRTKEFALQQPRPGNLTFAPISASRRATPQFGHDAK